MDKSTFSNYGWIVVVTIIIAILIGLATPFAVSLKANFIGVTNRLTEVANGAWNVIDNVKGEGNGGSGGPGGSGGGDDESVTEAYTYGDAIDQGDYRYFYVGCKSYDEFAAGTVKLEFNCDVSVPLYSESEIFEILSEDFFGCSWTEAQAQGHTEEELYEIYGISQEWYEEMQTYGFDDGWNVVVRDTTQSTYAAIPEQVDGVPVVCMDGTFSDCVSLTTAPEVPFGVTKMRNTFSGCTSLTTAPMIPSGVTDMEYAFLGCELLIAAPSLPNSVTNMRGTFWDCADLTTVPALPNSVTDLTDTFRNCTSLKVAPDMSNVTKTENMILTFFGCSSLEVVPSLPDGVIDMRAAFDSCTSLVSVPDIPNSVKYMHGTFSGCTSLVTAPVISSNVTNLACTFKNCTSLTGVITINTNKIDKIESDSDFPTPLDIGVCECCFDGVDMTNITLTGSASKQVLNLIGSTGKNWTPIP